VTYPVSQAGQTVSFSFTLTQTKYGERDVYETVTYYEAWDILHWFPKTKKVKVGTEQYIKDQQTKIFYGSLTLPEVGSCQKESAPVAPTFVEPTCDSDAAINLPETVGVVYTVQGEAGPGKSVTVVATPAEGYVFAGESQSVEYSYTFGTPDCTPSPPPCKFIGADKDGGVDAYGGTNDDCAPKPPVVTPPAPPVATPPETPQPCVAVPSSTSTKKSVTQRFVRFVRTITFTKTTTTNADCSKTAKVKRTVTKVAVKKPVAAKPKPKKPVKLPKPDKPKAAPKTL
jgi:hypothetical protein